MTITESSMGLGVGALAVSPAMAEDILSTALAASSPRWFSLSTAQLLALALCCVTPLADLKVRWHEGHSLSSTGTFGEAGGGMEMARGDFSCRATSLARLDTKFRERFLRGDLNLPGDPSSIFAPSLGLSGVSPQRSSTSYSVVSTQLLLFPVSRSTSSLRCLETSLTTLTRSGLEKSIELDLSIPESWNLLD